MRKQLVGADTKSLIAMRGDIAAVVASCQSAAQQARAAVADENASNIANAAQGARSAVNDVMRGMKDFEPYLHFANAQDEADYRRREEERRARIAEEQAKGTPQGDLNASGAAVGQMADAAAHGAGDSPEFQRRWDKLTASTEALRTQLIREGKDVSEFDKHLREDLRAIMRAKGVPDTQIDALLAAHRDNPMDAMKEFVAEQKGVISEREITDLTRKAQAYKEEAAEKTTAARATGPARPTDIPAAALDAMADLKALGTSVANHDVSEPPSHGIIVSSSGTSRQVGTGRS